MIGRIYRIWANKLDKNAKYFIYEQVLVSVYRTNDIPNKVCILRLYTIKSQYAHFIRNIISSIFAETISRSRILVSVICEFLTQNFKKS